MLSLTKLEGVRRPEELVVIGFVFSEEERRRAFRIKETFPLDPDGRAATAAPVLSWISCRKTGRVTLPAP